MREDLELETLEERRLSLRLILIHASSTVYSVNTCYSLLYLSNQIVLIFNRLVLLP
jgi:hypothetical protein